MRDSIKRILREEYKSLLPEQRKPKEVEGCGVFSDIDERDFCKVVEKELSDNLSEYKNLMANLLEKYFKSDDRISKIQMEKLDSESEIVKVGFKEIDDVVKLISANCPSGKDVALKEKNKWISKYNLYFKDENGKYHLLNRLNTNYTAMAVLITIFYEELLEQVRAWTSRKTTPSVLFAKDWIDHFFNPKIPLIDPRKGWRDDMTRTSTELVDTPNPISVFDKTFNPQDFEIEESEYHNKFMKALEQVRKKGFKTEDLFEKKLKEEGIEYKRYGYDYSFVDMVLGVDFLIKQRKKGSDFWVPVQVKSHFKERFNLIDKFKCTKIIKPELIESEQDFMIGDIRGFKEYFCEDQTYCRKNNTKKVYAPPSVDYFSSRDWEI